VSSNRTACVLIIHGHAILRDGRSRSFLHRLYARRIAGGVFLGRVAIYAVLLEVYQARGYSDAGNDKTHNSFLRSPQRVIYIRRFYRMDWFRSDRISDSRTPSPPPCSAKTPSAADTAAFSTAGSSRGVAYILSTLPGLRKALAAC